MPQPRVRRLVQLFVGLALYGVSSSMLLLAGLGLDPWDVLHQGLSRRIGLGVGTWAIIAGFAVLLLWIPLRQRPGIGTICNVFVVGGVIDAVLAVVPTPHAIAVRVPLLLGGVLLNGVATGAYIGAGLGPGPRDGLMTGWAARGHSIRVVRTTIEISVLAIGWALGGDVGVGTVVYALSIGPLAHKFIPLLAIPMPRRAGEAEAGAGASGAGSAGAGAAGAEAAGAGAAAGAEAAGAAGTGAAGAGAAGAPGPSVATARGGRGRGRAQM